MAAARPQPAPPRDQPIYLLAAQQYQRTLGAVQTDPLDLVAGAHPYFMHPNPVRQCTALAGPNCAESVLRLAYSHVLNDESQAKHNEASAGRVALRTRVPPAGLTLSSMIRRLQHLDTKRPAITSFPVYVLDMQLVTCPPNLDGMTLRPNFVLTHGVPRPDMLAIVFMPPMPGFPLAHWTFTSVDPVLDVIPLVTLPSYPVNQPPVVIFTKAPITDLYPQVYWRCHPTSENNLAYEAKRALGQACRCSWQVICPHELWFMMKHPTAVRLTLCAELMLNGAYRCTVEPGSDPGVELGSERRVFVRHDRFTTILPAAWNNALMRRPALQFGSIIIPWEQTGLNRIMPIVHFVRLGRTWFEKAFPCYYWYTEDAKHVATFVVRPFKLTGRLYPLRVPTVITILLRFLCSMVVIYAMSIVRSSILTVLTELLPSTILSFASKCKGWSFKASNAIGFTGRQFSYFSRAVSILYGSELSYTTQVYIREILQALHLVSKSNVVTDPYDIVEHKLLLPERLIKAMDILFPMPDTVIDVATAAVDNFASAVTAASTSVDDGLSGIMTNLHTIIAPRPTGWRGHIMHYIEVVSRHVQQNWRGYAQTLARSATTTGFIAMYAYTVCVPLVDAYRALKDVCQHVFWRAVRWHFFTPVETIPATLNFSHLPPGLESMPRADEFQCRMAMRPRDTIDRDLAYDILRRHANSANYEFSPSIAEVELWVESVIATHGRTPQPLLARTAGQCINCRAFVPTYRGECRTCKHYRRTHPPKFIPLDSSCASVGRVGLWSELFVVPDFVLKPDVRFSNLRTRKRYGHMTQSRIMSLISTDPPVVTCRGFNAGPIFLGNRPKLFPLGNYTAVLAFCIRLGLSRAFEADAISWHYMLEFMRSIISETGPIEPESEALFLSHFTGAKLQLMLEAQRTVHDGNVRFHTDRTRTGGFGKVEKSYAELCKNTSLDWTIKDRQRPRFICAPRPEHNFYVGPYTHAQLKWLASVFTCTSHIFYAGCADPPQMNTWLRFTRRELVDAVTLADDIEMCDANHSSASFKYCHAIFDLLFPFCPLLVRLVLFAEQFLKVRIGNWIVEVDNVNGSGVPDTSWKTSIICLVGRVLAIAHAIRSLDSFASDEERNKHILSVVRLIYTSAAGDDGLTRLPRVLLGVDVLDPNFREAYEGFWKRLGFRVKCAFYPEHKWRMATYLAMRPVWDGTDYSWAPEPARRLRGAFWLYDQKMHPTAWARGIATQLLQMGAHQPVIGSVASWFLTNTSGPVADVTLFDNPNSPWHSYNAQASANVRADAEFCMDYSVPSDALASFRRLLAQTPDVYVTINHFVIARVFDEES